MTAGLNEVWAREDRMLIKDIESTDDVLEWLWQNSRIIVSERTAKYLLRKCGLDPERAEDITVPRPGEDLYDEPGPPVVSVPELICEIAEAYGITPYRSDFMDFNYEADKVVRMNVYGIRRHLEEEGQDGT